MNGRSGPGAFHLDCLELEPTFMTLAKNSSVGSSTTLSPEATAPTTIRGARCLNSSGCSSLLYQSG